MIVSEARRDANRRNARLSTGPKTAEGKAISRANSLKHGLCASKIVAEDASLVEIRSLEWYDALKPQDDIHLWMIDVAAVSSLRIDRAQRMERRIRDKRSLRAELCWDDDRQLDAARLGKLIRQDPAEVVAALKRTPQGCEWLMARWAMLAYAYDVKACWTPAQKRLAFDLLATPEEFRDGFEPGVALDFNGKPTPDVENPAAIARREIAALKERRDAVEPIDEALQVLAINDLSDDEADPELKKLRRYENMLHNRVRWCVKQINTESPYKSPAVAPQKFAEEVMPLGPRAVPEPEAVLHQEPIQPLTKFDHPPFDLTPDEYPAADEVADIPAILAARAEKKRVKAAKTRNDRRRKLEKLRSAS